MSKISVDTLETEDGLASVEVVNLQNPVHSDIEQAGVGSMTVFNMVRIYQADFDLITPDEDTFYIILEDVV